MHAIKDILAYFRYSFNGIDNGAAEGNFNRVSIFAWIGVDSAESKINFYARVDRSVMLGIIQ